MSCCRQCGRELHSDEIGLYKKMINRGAQTFLCIDCLAGILECRPELLREKIRYFRKTGCMLFLQEGEEPDPWGR